MEGSESGVEGTIPPYPSAAWFWEKATLGGGVKKKKSPLRGKRVLKTQSKKQR